MMISSSKTGGQKVQHNNIIYIVNPQFLVTSYIGICTAHVWVNILWADSQQAVFILNSQFALYKCIVKW